MMTDKTRQILLAARPSGQVKLSDFTLRENFPYLPRALANFSLGDVFFR